MVPSILLPILLLLINSWTLVHAATTCSVLNYGGKADNATDLGPAILSAYNNCVKGKTTTNPADTVLLVPSGNYLMKSTVTISSSSYFTLEIDGTVTVAFITSLSGTMFYFETCNHVTLKGSGTVNGQGSLWRPGSSLTAYPSRPRLFRFENCNNCDISGVYLVNSPMFHMTVIGNNNYIHDQKIKADHIGETDGYDISGNNNYVYNVDVENGDECVTVKSPTNGFLAKQITCYYTAGCNIGSFGDGGAAAVNNVTYTGVSLSYSDSGFMIKSYPDATGYVTNVLYEDSTMNLVAYPLDIDMYWEGASDTPASIYASGITYSGITGTGDTNTNRPLIKIHCLPGHTCTNLKYENVQLTSSVSKTNQITNGCGTGLTGLPAC